jgi:hypothetical protein
LPIPIEQQRHVFSVAVLQLCGLVLLPLETQVVLAPLQTSSQETLGALFFSGGGASMFVH